MTATTELGAMDLPVTGEQVVEIVSQVWDSFLGLTLEPMAPGTEPAELTGSVMCGLVAITGAWQGSVVLRCSHEHGVAAAEAMFAADPGSLEDGEIADALGELTNMVGGNIKGLLPEPSSLSIPSVTGGNDQHVFVPAATPVLNVGLRCDDATILVTVWQV